MDILSLGIRNFRSYEGSDGEIEIPLRKGTNIIVGENNVGKSSLFKALRILSGQDSLNQMDYYKGEQDRELLLEAQLELNTEELYTIIKAITRNSKQFQKLADLKRFAKDFGNKFTFTYSSKVGYRLRNHFLKFVEKDAYLIIDYNTSALTGDDIEGLLHQYFNKFDKLTLEDVIRKKVVPVHSSYRLSFKEAAPEEIRKMFSSKLKVFDEIRKRPRGENKRIIESLDGGNVASVLRTLKNGNREERKKFDLVKREFTRLFPDLKLEVMGNPDENPLIVIEKSAIDYEVPIEYVGAGIGEMIILLTHLVQSKDMIFCLDLPEMQFHPHSQRLLRKILDENATSNQILIVTHSPLLLNPKKIENITIIRERYGKTRTSKLAEDFFNQEERRRIERFLYATNRDFFFSKATLIVEGQTETGAMPVFSEALNNDCDIQGISVVETGKHFGLFSKLLRGFNIPYIVMVDRDALINVENSIKVGNKRIMTSPVFFNLTHLLTEEDAQYIVKLEREIVEINENKYAYMDNEFKHMRAIAEKYKVFVLSSDFEGVLKKEGYMDLLKEAASISESKVIQGRFVAERILKQKGEVPSEFRSVINALMSLTTPVERDIKLLH